MSDDNTGGSSPLLAKGEFVLKIVFWVLPLVFAAGVWYNSSGDAVRKMHEYHEVSQKLEKRLEEHEALESHPVSRTRLDTVQKAVERIEIEQRALGAEQRRAAENLSAICQATNANCR